MTLALKHQTKAQFAERLRARYKSSSREGTAKIAKFILDRLDDGDFTDSQVRNVFGLTVEQWTNLKAKMTTMRTRYDGIRSAKGE